MENLVKELTQIMEFKDSLDIGDIVLILLEESQNGVYAQVTGIVRDDSRKDEWWHVGLAFLTMPVQQTTWTLRTQQMTGQEIFTMGGKKRFVKAVKIDVKSPELGLEEEKAVDNKKGFLKG